MLFFGWHVSRLKDGEKAQRLKAAVKLANSKNVRAVEPLLRTYLHDDPSVSEVAAAGLVNIGPPAVERLLATLHDTSERQRHKVMPILGAIGDKRAVAPLIKLLDECNEYDAPACGAAEALGELGDSMAVEPLIALVAKRTKANSIPGVAAQALGRIGDPRAIRPLLDLLASDIKNPRSRRLAVSALGSFNHPDAIAALVASLGNWDSDVRGAAEEALKQLGPAAVDALIDAMAKPDPPSRVVALLREMKDARAVPAVHAALTHTKSFKERMALVETLTALGWKPASESDRMLQLVFGRFFGSIGESKETLDRKIVASGAAIVPPLLEALGELSSTPNPCVAVAHLLGEIGDERAVAPLAQQLNAYYQYTRVGVVPALARFGSKAVEPLLARLSHQDADMRRAIAKALGGIGDARALEPLRARLTDSFEGAREEAKQAIARIEQRAGAGGA